MSPTQPHSIHDTSVVRQEVICNLQPLCRALAEAFGRRGVPPADMSAVWRADVVATCPKCGIIVSGEELYALSKPPAAESASAKIGRLRLGDCARSGCDSYHYQLAFKPHGEVAWTELLSQAEGILQERQPPAISPTIQDQLFEPLRRLFLQALRLAVFGSRSG